MEGLHREGQNAELCALSLWSRGASPPITTLCSWSESSPQLSVQRSCRDFITVLCVTDTIFSTSSPLPRPRAGFGPKTLDLHQALGVPGEQPHPEATSLPQHKSSISITKTFLCLRICAGFLNFCARNQAQRPGIFMIMPHCLREVPYRASFGEDSSECWPHPAPVPSPMLAASCLRLSTYGCPLAGFMEMLLFPEAPGAGSLKRIACWTDPFAGCISTH